MSEAGGMDGSGRAVRLPTSGMTLEGELVVPPEARGVVLFAHGSGSSRHSPRNRYVARAPRRRPDHAADRPAHVR